METHETGTKLKTTQEIQWLKSENPMETPF